MELRNVHLALGAGVIASWLVVCFWALGLRLARRESSPPFWRVVSFSQILLLLQLLLGVVLFALGGRPGAGGAYTNVFHTLYGFGFPALVLFFGHKWSREGRHQPFAVFAVAGLVIMALATRAFMVGLLGA